MKDFNPQKCVNNTQQLQNDVHTKASTEDSYTELSNEFDEVLKRIESPKMNFGRLIDQGKLN